MAVWIQGYLDLDIPIHEPEEGKVCAYCGIKKDLKHFGARLETKDKKDHRCNRCKNEHSRIRNEIRKTSPQKRDVCDCCGQSYHLMYLDHNHKTNKFRGWLCHKCNSGIGYLGDTIEGLEKAIAYLRKSDGQ